LKNIDKKYFRLNDALFALEYFEDGVYHLLGMEGLFRGRLNHLIGIKIGDKMQIFDYATDEKIKKI
jgi:hypothetical protein